MGFTAASSKTPTGAAPPMLDNAANKTEDQTKQLTSSNGPTLLFQF
jgi:hypothetical protein